MPTAPAYRFEDFCENPPEEDLPPLDRRDPGADFAMTPDAAYWREHGYLILRKFMPNELVDAYCNAFQAKGRCPWGWGEAQPYLHEPEMLDLCCHPPLLRKIE